MNKNHIDFPPKDEYVARSWHVNVNDIALDANNIQNNDVSHLAIWINTIVTIKLGFLFVVNMESIIQLDMLRQKFWHAELKFSCYT
jgi:hypothetical protein